MPGWWPQNPREEDTAIHARHVSLVTETYPPEINGVALTVARLADGLRERGHTISVIRPRQASDPPGRARDAASVLVRGIPLPGYGGLRLGLPCGAALRTHWTWRRPDAVYVATEGPLGWSAVSAARRLGVPVLSGFHTNFDGYMRHYHARWLERVAAGYLKRFHNRTAGTLVATSELRADLATRGFARIGVLGRGVDARLFTPARRSAALRRVWGASESDLVVLYAGRLAPEKNLGLAVEAYRAIRREAPGTRFVVVGAGPIRAALERAHPDLIFAGPLTGERLATHYASADVFLFPSQTETFGNVVLEAQASGLAIVAYDYAAARAHVIHGETGVLINFGHGAAFVDGAVALARAPEDVRRLGQRARESVTRVGWDAVVERFEALLMGGPLDA